jgi:hypothetical protein
MKEMYFDKIVAQIKEITQRRGQAHGGKKRVNKMFKQPDLKEILQKNRKSSPTTHFASG